MEVTDQKMSNPPGYKHSFMSVTSNIGKDIERLINITKLSILSKKKEVTRIKVPNCFTCGEDITFNKAILSKTGKQIPLWPDQRNTHSHDEDGKPITKAFTK